MGIFANLPEVVPRFGQRQVERERAVQASFGLREVVALAQGGTDVGEQGGVVG